MNREATMMKHTQELNGQIAGGAAIAEATETATLTDVVRQLKRIESRIAENNSELLRADDAARLCGVSRATWDRLRSASKVPAPVRLGDSVMWSRKTLLAWIADGCGQPG